MKFTWDPAKAKANLRKHRVTFEEAATVFRDPSASVFDDPDHSEGEHREIIIGYSVSNRLLLVSFTEREEAVRLIGARRTDARERQKYEETR